MEERKNYNNKKMILTILGIAVLLVATIGATFAYFSATSKTVNQNVTTGELKVATTSTVANNTNLKPTTWDLDVMDNNDSNADIAKITLSVDTTGTSITTGTYDIQLTTTGIELKDQIDSSSTEGGKIDLVGGKLEDVKWALYKASEDDPAKGTDEVAKGTFCVKKATEDACDDTKTDGDVEDLKLNTDSVKIDSENFDGEGKSIQVDKYILYIWIENTEDTENVVGSGKQDKLQAMNISATLKVNAKQ